MPTSKLGRMFLGATLVVVWLMGVHGAEAQCSKHILIYLDVSGSMAPQGKQISSSPYHLTVEALGLLLRAQGLIEDGDYVEASIFGSEPILLAESKGRASIETLLAKLEGYRQPASETELSAALRDATNRLSKGGSFNQRVLIVASDFAHEPRDGMPLEEANQSWRQTYSSLEPSLRTQLSDGKTILVLLEAPILKNPKRQPFYEGMKDVTLAAIQATQPAAVRMPVGEGGLDASSVASGIRRSLMRPLKVGSPSRARGNKDELLLEVANPNCAETTIERVALRCIRAGGGNGELVGVAVPVDQQRLEAAGRSEGTRVLNLETPKGGCWEESTSSFEASVRTTEGLESTGAGTSGTWIEARPTRAFFETPFIITPGVLWLDLELKGVYVQPAQYQLNVLSASGESVASTAFAAPASLEPGNWRRYRIFLKPTKTETVEIAGPLTLKIPASRIEATRFPGATEIADLGKWRDVICWLGSIGALIIWAYLSLRGPGKYPELSHRRKLDGMAHLAGVSMTAFPPILLLLRAWVLQSTTIDFANMIYIFIPAMFVTVLAYFAVRKFITESVDLAVARKEIKSREDLQARSYRPILVAAVCGATLAIALTVGWLGIKNMDSDSQVETLSKAQP